MWRDASSAATWILRSCHTKRATHVQAQRSNWSVSLLLWHNLNYIIPLDSCQRVGAQLDWARANMKHNRRNIKMKRHDTKHSDGKPVRGSGLVCGQWYCIWRRGWINACSQSQPPACILRSRATLQSPRSSSPTKPELWRVLDTVVSSKGSDDAQPSAASQKPWHFLLECLDTWMNASRLPHAAGLLCQRKQSSPPSRAGCYFQSSSSRHIADPQAGKVPHNSNFSGLFTIS